MPEYNSIVQTSQLSQARNQLSHPSETQQEITIATQVDFVVMMKRNVVGILKLSIAV